MHYYGQYQQDKYLDENIFKGKEKGVFLDLGAYDGMTISNTWFFERYRQWEGLCVEPLPSAFGKLKANRRCYCLNACISGHRGKALFQKVEGNAEVLSGIYEFLHPIHKERIQRENQGGRLELVEIDCYTMNDLFDMYPFEKVDFCSLDIEGGELEALKAVNFAKCRIDFLLVENNYYGRQLQDFLATQAYCLEEILGGDELYRRL